MPEGFLNGIVNYLPLILAFVALVLVMVIPQKKKDKAFKKIIDSMKVGDTVKTIGCIYGKIVRIKEDLVTIETGPDKTTFEISKDGISAVSSTETKTK